MVLRGLTIEGVGVGLTGVKVVAAGRVVLERCTVQNFTQSGIDFDSTTPGAQLVVSDSTFNNNAIPGSQIAPVSPGTAYATITRARLMQNTYGVLAKGGAVTIRDSILSANALAGAKAQSTATVAVQMAIDDSAISDNVSPAIGIISQGAMANVLVSRSIITNNGTGVLTAGGATSTSSDNRIFGNTNPSSTMTVLPQQ